MTAYNPGSKKAGHDCRRWALDLERCLCRDFSNNSLQKVATKAVLGCSKQNQGDSFSLCDSAARLRQSIQRLFGRQEGEKLKTAE